jgi:hypothetical protein
MHESFGSTDLPEEITLNEGFQVDDEGRAFAYEKDGVKYGGDFLPETPGELSLDDENELPPPEEANPVL